MLSAADELAYEANARESDPLNLDGAAGLDPFGYPAIPAAAWARWQAEHAAREAAEPLSKVAETVAFYRELMGKPRFDYFLKVDARGCATEIGEALCIAEACIDDGNWLGAHYWKDRLVEACEALDDRISDLASD